MAIAEHEHLPQVAACWLAEQRETRVACLPPLGVPWGAQTWQTRDRPSWFIGRLVPRIGRIRARRRFTAGLRQSCLRTMVGNFQSNVCLGALMQVKPANAVRSEWAVPKHRQWLRVARGTSLQPLTFVNVEAWQIVDECWCLCGNPRSRGATAQDINVHGSLAALPYRSLGPQLGGQLSSRAGNRSSPRRGDGARSRPGCIRSEDGIQSSPGNGLSTMEAERACRRGAYRR